MSTPGGPQPPEHDPAQPGQPQGWGQRQPAWGPPPAGPPPGLQPTAGQPSAGPPPQAWGQQPAAGQQPAWGQQPPAGQPWGPPPGAQPFGQPDPRAKRRRRWVTLLGPVLVLAVVGLSLVRNLTGAGDPATGDCIQASGSEDFETVDCDSDEAQYRIVGTDEDMTGLSFDLTDANDLCLDFPQSTAVFWYGTNNADNGTVYCAVDA